MTRAAPLLALLLTAFLGLTVQAETFGARVMAPGLLSDLAPGEGQSFRHSRALPAADPDAAPAKSGLRRLEAVSDAPISVTATPEAKLILTQDGRQVAEFPQTSPHPVLLMFLENVMRSVAQETGGNPHYIRNRMRMTLGAAELSGDLLQIAPFATDPNRNRFGAFADLQLDIHWAPGAPGKLLKLSASLPNSPERYSETLISDTTE